MNHRYITIAITIYSIGIVEAIAQNPLSNKFITHYQSDIIMPAIDKRIMNKEVIDFYIKWQGKYIKPDKESKGEFIRHDNGDNKNSKTEWTSEGQGYGMLVTVLMAKFNATAKQSFNSLFKHYYAHRSHYSSDRDKPNKYPFLMVDASTSNKSMGGTATDGDLDIAYSLLLADKVWGSTGKIKYAAIAHLMLEAIKLQEINKRQHTILMGNETEDEISTNHYYGYDDMRASDFMPSHLTIFKAYDTTYDWGNIKDTCYNMFLKMQTHGATFIPDFIHNVNNPIAMNSKTARKAGLSQETNTDAFAYNGCRIPWRVAMGYILNGDSSAKEIVEKMNNYIRKITNDNPSLINEGYKVDGGLIISDDNTPSPLFFTAPFAVSAMVDSNNQDWINRLWGNMIKKGTTSYYGDTIKMIALIILSGNYWTEVRK